jgi:3,4-dihydroxy 2-butanone 4-phosphate synthase/GTP cyclohydrolase II
MLDTIESAIEDIRNGKLVIVVDDEDRENEGDFLTAARNATPEIITFMGKHGKGLICAPLSEERCDELGLQMMVKDNTELHQTAFTVSVDLIGHGCTTGISSNDRSKTIQALINPATKPSDLAKPGHIFPLKARKEGVLRRAGHTEAAIDLARLAGFEPAGVIVEIVDEDGEMARLPRLLEIAKEHQLKIISIEEVSNTSDYAYDLTVEDTRNFDCMNGLCVRDTFHLSGVATKSNVTRGVPRIEEILRLTRNPDKPSATVFLKPVDQYDKDKATNYCNMIQHTVPDAR